MRQRIHRILSNFEVDQLGSCFMVIVTVDMVTVIMEVVSIFFSVGIICGVESLLMLLRRGYIHAYISEVEQGRTRSNNRV